MATEIKLILIAVGLAAAFAAGWYFNGLRAKAAADAIQAADFKSLEAAYVQRQNEDAAKLAQQEKELGDLKDNALKFPDVVFRVCRIAAAPVPAAGGQGQVVHPAGGVVQAEPKPVPQVFDPDYGPFLFGLADAADRLAAKCRGL